MRGPEQRNAGHRFNQDQQRHAGTERVAPVSILSPRMVLPAHKEYDDTALSAKYDISRRLEGYSE